MEPIPLLDEEVAAPVADESLELSSELKLERAELRRDSKLLAAAPVAEASADVRDASTEEAREARELWTDATSDLLSIELMTEPACEVKELTREDASPSREESCADAMEVPRAETKIVEKRMLS
jgi:hypothetical protein